MGKPLLQWFVYSLVISPLFAAYLARHAISAGSPNVSIEMRIAGVCNMRSTERRQNWPRINY
jgi:hypothetical protein